MLGVSSTGGISRMEGGQCEWGEWVAQVKQEVQVRQAKWCSTNEVSGQAAQAGWMVHLG